MPEKGATDGACDTRKCPDAIVERGAHAVIPPRKKSKPCKTATAGAIARNEALRALKFLGCALATPLGGNLRMRLPGNG